MNDAEREHLERIKELPCSVCGQSGPSYAHHLLLGRGTGQKKSPHWLTIPLCFECHQGRNGIHGDRAIWRIYHEDELSALASTIERLMR